ncbi:hypothetical protein ACFQS2_08100 [Brachybacterium sp. GCM10030267]|uniref:hypothetical protein n=1 Tax=Brachybacterium sp. GCM10030267 TaxID=3273381 RepID=UPI0036154943
MSTPDRPDPTEDPGGSGDIDAEFARLTEGLSLDEGAPLTVDDVLSDGEDDQEPTLAVVATSVASAKALAGAIRLGREARTDGIDIPAATRTLDTRTGAIAVGALPENTAHDLAAIASTALQRNGIVLFWRRGDRMTATRYRNGERGEDVSPAIVLGAVDDIVEQLLLGATGLDELDEGIDPATITRTEALKWIASGKKRS